MPPARAALPALTDTDGHEYIKVKVPLNGTRDTHPFAPEDLASTSRSPKTAEVKGSTPIPPTCHELVRIDFEEPV